MEYPYFAPSELIINDDGSVFHLHLLPEQVAQKVILVGENQTKPIKKALDDNKFTKVHIINDVKEAFTLMNKLKDKNTYVLLENDLPDIFNEK